jgi:hypothetical protein
MTELVLRWVESTKELSMDHKVSNWDARHIRRPGQEPVLSVTGECRLPATYRMVLNVHEPQGEDPSQLVLDLIIENPSGKPSTTVEGLANMNIAFKMPTEETYSSVLISDINADAGTEDETVWTVPVKLIDWGTTAAPNDSKRWKNKAVASHREN